MLFRDITTGKLVNIKRENYHCDTDYYRAICNIMNVNFPKSENEQERILKLINVKKIK